MKQRLFAIGRFFKERYRRFRVLSWQKQTAIIGGTLLAVMILVPLLTYAYFVRDIANEERLMNRNNTGVIMLDRHGEEFYRAYGANTSDGERIDFDDIPAHVVDALLVAEDREFYEHGGYSFRRIMASLYANVLNRDATRYGGSTITQQLAKNALLTDDKNYFRKYQELALAIAIERHYEKDKILELYLNSVYFGEGAFGIDDAAQTYFDKSAQELTPAESAMLMSILPAPSSWSPVSGDRDTAEQRQARLLEDMAELGYITEAERETITAQQLTYSEPDIEDAFAMHFAEMVLDELREQYSEERIARSGFQVTTTLDMAWQEQAENTTRNHIAQVAALDATNGSVVAIDSNTGGIRTLVGSSDWEDEEFGMVNMATALRQPGSSFKSIYYAEALARGDITPVTMITDEPTTFGGDYEPQNFDRRFRGDVTVRHSLANSLNIPSVKIMEELGVEETVEVAQRMGIESIDDPQQYGLALALGAAEARLLDMTNAYAAFGTGGIQHEPTTIEQIRNKYGETIYEENPQSERVLDEAGAFLISSILSDDNARSATFGGSLSIPGPVAVKTGTTDDNRDAWTIGYTRDVAVGVWVGNNSNERMQAVTGSTGASPIWRGVMNEILADIPAEDFHRPGNVVSEPVCTSNNLPAESSFPGTYTEYFLRGTLPSGRCEEPPEPEEEEEEESQEEDEAPADQDEDAVRDEEEEEEEPPEEDEEDDDDDDEEDEDDESEGNQSLLNPGL